MRRQDVDMLSGSIVKGLLAISIPVMIMNVLQSLFSVIDMTILKNFDLSGDTSIGAVGVCSTLITLITGLVIGITSGANVVIARHIGRRDPDSVRAVLAHPRLKDRFDLYGEAYKKLKVPEDVPEDLRFLYIKKGFGIEHNATKAEWEALRTHEMADILAADLAAMAPLQQLMQRMRANAEHAQAQAVREQEEAQRVPEEAPKPEKLTVRSAEEFEF